jgi:hypothetical protein
MTAASIQLGKKRQEHYHQVDVPLSWPCPIGKIERDVAFRRKRSQFLMPKNMARQVQEDSNGPSTTANEGGTRLNNRMEV